MSKSQVGVFKPSFCKRLPHLLEEYVASCRPPPEADPKKNPGRLANFAGFCRYLGCTLQELYRLRESDSTLFERLCAVFEDELLNHSPSPTILNAYMKKRLGYADEEKEDGQEIACREMRLVFEHDIAEDGA
ncbi:MAG: hypothetical protein IJW30_06025 [Clostridia bacterium]|nr:hypothetical protein [Clostridia bacterium]MBQ9774205.1 hypothetical protein [Clostridia bacterium]